MEVPSQVSFLFIFKIFSFRWSEVPDEIWKLDPRRNTFRHAHSYQCLQWRHLHGTWRVAALRTGAEKVVVHLVLWDVSFKESLDYDFFPQYFLTASFIIIPKVSISSLLRSSNFPLDPNESKVRSFLRGREKVPTPQELHALNRNLKSKFNFIFRTSKFYDCCPKPYVDITYTIHVRRKPLFYTLYLIVPAIIITAMVLVGFYLPPESGERMQLGITVLLAMIVFLQLVYQNLPSTSNSAPLLGKFYIVTMFLIALSLAATCLVLNYSYGRHCDGEMPMWVRMIILHCLGRVFGSSNNSGKRRRTSMSGRTNEWKIAASILDKFFMAFFAFIITVVALYFFYQAPH